MPIGWWEILLTGFIGGLICLDRVAVFQFKISRPIVAAPLIGLVLGQVAIGVVMGGMLELLWVGRSPIGGRIPPHESLCSIVITAGVIMAGAATLENDKELMVLGILLGMPLARIGSFLEDRLRTINDTLARKAFHAVTSGKSEKVHHFNLEGLVFTFLNDTLFIIFFSTLLWAFLARMQPVADVLPPPLPSALRMLFPFIPLVGVAGALKTINVSKSHYAFTTSFVVVFILLNI